MIDIDAKGYYNTGMEKYRTRRIVTIAISLVIIAVAIAAMVSVARALFFSNNGNTADVTASQQALISTNADRSVSMTVRGPIVANEDFRTYTITITPNGRAVVVSKGYLATVVSNTKLANNIPAYEQFVYALNKANMMRGTELTGDANDIRGVCATGHVYEFSILKNNTAEKTLWTSTCSSAHGSLNATLSQLTGLFNVQIPEIKSITGKL